MKTKAQSEYLAKVRRVIGYHITKLREERRMTQTELAERVGVNNATLSKIESGKWMSLEMLLRISEALGYKGAEHLIIRDIILGMK